MNHTTTTTGKIMTTVALSIALFEYQPVERLVKVSDLLHNGTPTQFEMPKNFEDGYEVVDHKIVRSILVTEVAGINSLLQIGKVIFLGAHGETDADLKAKKAYFNSRYKKA